MTNATKFGLVSIICSLIIGGSMMMVQVNKQNSIERQQEAKLQVERDTLNYQKEQDEKKASADRLNKTLRTICLRDATDSYWSYMELNGTGKRDEEGGVVAKTWVWDEAKSNRKDAEDACYRKYN